MRLVDAAIALVNVFLHVPHVVVFEAVGLLRRRGEGVVFQFEVFRVGFRTGAQVLFGVCEEVVWTGSHQVGTADGRRGEGQVGGFAGRAHAHELVAHELLEQLALFGGHFGGFEMGEGLAKGYWLELSQ